ncbi:bifunctional UDP-N-acetylglucosamine diphosphorylase/glucosamine-1-phosphate N-acetyltransferase GlmU [Tissierella praeacuta]|uniref:Bifunctional protein GlmU n=1 Tax=Tissierella praeacuta DSM 18095 TaxID=1123404 RepID=A0A1M4UNB9_9FIRM|nr:bifunctional UDP-N-acetylglucosamine diphosphorylase/glucosamine-1-phosphate N-acetyltransferase GlmU [Tissierella praeacuta]SHE58073.1 UDP-N-acetylglucosamine pyrophosphorylase /glucosamine-1-phosphate N-acetyltransferase [Tissierella praeacuta DSM 18095]SUP03518.1 Bifunctional protein GlmU [Tissierella praeacuta]HAE91619.1 bifunctional UDP-N-acetylglucosamine diphosphorylase/glucosamine-1-phosphate N-acetyltransferase GlmU [Tissierella sp.]
MNISVILAAGEGTRMKSKIPKVLHEVCGKPILEYVINASKGASVEKNVVIVGHGGDIVREYFKEEPIIFKTQPIGDDVPYGTGFAVMQAMEDIDDSSTVVILYGDTPLITESTIDELINYHSKNQFKATVLTAILDDPTGYGRIIREDTGDILKIVEQKDASEEEKKIKEINSGIYCFDGKLLKYALGKIDNNNAQNEYYVTDVIGILKEEGHKVGAYIIENSTEIHGVNSRVQLAFSEEVMRKRISEYHMVNGVTIINPDNTYIEDGVKIGRDTIIYPGVSLEGNTEIGEDCIIGSNSRIVESMIHNNVSIESSTIENSVVGENTHIGPYAHLRPNSNIGKNAKIGNFVEVKNSTLKDNTKASHLAYIGDADIGHDVNIGCGVVFVNYNGKEKFRTTVGDNAFVGSNSNLVAPVNVESWGYVAAGSTITKEVPEGTLSIARAEQKNIEGWVERKGYKK